MIVIEKSKSGKRDSNSRPQPWQGCALPTELFPPKKTSEEDETRTHTSQLTLPPQSSASTNSATPPLFLLKRSPVPRTGLEPARLSTLAPETSASTIPPPGLDKSLGPLRAENETRTRDPNLGKVVLYQLSYFRLL